MIEALYQLGKYAKKKHPELAGFDPPFDEGWVICILFETDGENVQYKDVITEKYDSLKLEKYLYGEGTPNGTDYSPTAKLTDIEKTLPKKIIASIQEIGKNNPNDTVLNSLLTEIDNQSDAIINEIIKIKNTDKKASYLLTIKVDDRYIGEFEAVKENFDKRQAEQYWFKKTIGQSKSKNQNCFVCGLKKEVYGFTSTYAFYTVDNPGMVTGGFNQSLAWKNYPVCGTCGTILEIGRKYVEMYYTGQMGRVKYSVIPKMIHTENDEIMNDLSNLEKRIRLKMNTHIFYEKEENDFVAALAEENNYASFNFLFFYKNNSAEVIVLYMEDVLPSRISKVLTAKSEVEKDEIYKDSMPTGKENEKDDFKLNFSQIKYNFFPGDYPKDFYELINAVFTNKPVDSNYLISAFMSAIRDKQPKDYISTRYSLMVYEFILELNLFKAKKSNKEEIKMPETTEKNQIFLEFLEKKRNVFDTDAKCSAFLIGILTKKLLNIQYVDRKSNPFYSRLNSLKIDEKLLHRIFVEAQNKLNEYGKNFYQTLEELASEFLTQSDFKGMTMDEISYYFVLGMNLCDKFKIKEEEKEEAENGRSES